MKINRNEGITHFNFEFAEGRHDRKGYLPHAEGGDGREGWRWQTMVHPGKH